MLQVERRIQEKEKEWAKKVKEHEKNRKLDGDFDIDDFSLTKSEHKLLEER